MTCTCTIYHMYMYNISHVHVYVSGYIHYNFCPALCFVKLPGNVITEAVSVKKDHTPCPPYKLITAHLGGPPPPTQATWLLY